jgi:hypothetical protein
MCSDEIGNISSSSLRMESDKQSLELRLRYPMFGVFLFSVFLFDASQSYA